MGELLDGFMERRVADMEDTFLTDFIIDLRSGVQTLTDEQVTVISEEVTKRGIEDDYETSGGYYAQ